MVRNVCQRPDRRTCSSTSLPPAGTGCVRSRPRKVTAWPLSTRRRLTRNELAAGTRNPTSPWAGSVSGEPAYTNRRVEVVLPVAV